MTIERKQITLADVSDLARGAAILGTGGGGDPHIGALMLRQAIEDCGDVTLVDVASVDDDAFLVPFGMMGAPTVVVEKIPNGEEMITALRKTERWVGERARGIVCTEIGGVNALLPIVLAARCGLVVLDGDGIGRAFPQLQMVTFNLFGVPASPMVMADEHLNTVLVEASSALEVERIGRSVATAMGGISSICLYPMYGRDAKRCIVRGTLSLALGLGAAVREARRGGGSAIESLFAYLRSTSYYQHSRVLFEGKTVDLLRETKDGWAQGRVVIEGTGHCLGRHCTIEFQNEYLAAYEGGRVLTIVPDLIAILDSTTAEAITTEGLRYGQRVTAIGISAAPIVRSADALALFGPQAFGLNMPFVPLEEL